MKETAGYIFGFLMFGMTLGSAFANDPAPHGKPAPDLTVVSGVILEQAVMQPVGSSPEQSPKPPKVKWEMTWEIKNIGTAAAPASFVRFACSTANAQFVCPNVAQFSQRIPALAPQAAHTIRFYVSSVNSGGQREITATVDPWNAIADSNGRNNKLSVKF